MLSLGRLVGLAGAPTMEMGGMTMVGRHGGFNMHGPMLMAGKVDPSTNFSYPTNRQLILDTEAEVRRGEVERFPVVPYAFSSKFFGLFKNRDEGEPQLVRDQVMYNTRGAPGADFHAMFLNNLIVAQAGFLQENEGFNTYAMGRLNPGERGGYTFNVSPLVNWGFGVARAPDPDDHDRPAPPGSTASATESPPTIAGRRWTSTGRSSGTASSTSRAASAASSIARRPGSPSSWTTSSTTP